MRHEELEMTHEGRQRQIASQIVRIEELERELETTRGDASKHLQKHSTFQSNIRELEQRLQDLESEKGSHVRKIGTHESTIKDLEQRLASLHSEHSAAKRHS